MTPTREDLELYVTGNYDGDVAALERAIGDDPALGALVADEARFEIALRDAAAAATFCPACDELVRGERCDSCGAAVRPGGYVVERMLVGNAHGRMYVAHDADGKQVALKELAFVQPPSASTIAAFEREAKFLRALEHPAIPRFLASFEEGHGVHTRYYLAQELVAGRPLDELDDHWYSETEIVDIARQVLAILIYLQGLSPMVIHRDIKPANLVRRGDGSIALVDFGAAYVHGTTAGVTTVGTFGYMPIEQLAGIVDATTDLYALGASLLYLLTRQEPWRLAQSKTAVNASAPLRAFLDKLIAADPRDRFPSAQAALAALERRDELPVPRSRPRRPWLVPVLAAGVAATAGAAATYTFALHPATKAEQTPAPGTPATITIDASLTPLPTQFGTLRISLPPGLAAELNLDGTRIASVTHGSEVPVLAGVHAVVITGPHGLKCSDDNVRVDPGHVVTLECAQQEKPPAEHRLKRGEIVSWGYRDTNLHDVMLTAAATCDVNMVIPDSIQAKVTVDLKRVPCDQAIEVILESNALWYAYDPMADVIRVAPRRQLDAEAADRYARGPFAKEDDLPAGRPIDLDLKNAPLHDALRRIVTGGGAGVNLVVPEGIDGKVSVRLKGVPWDHALQVVLEGQGLWYRYRDKGKLIRVAPRRELDAEDAAQRQRGR